MHTFVEVCLSGLFQVLSPKFIFLDPENWKRSGVSSDKISYKKE